MNFQKITKNLGLLMILSCGCSIAGQWKNMDLVGKTVEYRYGESVYNVTFLSDSTLVWEAMAGEEKGIKEHETYVAEWIDKERLFITWGEASGIGVSQVLDFRNGLVHNHLLQEREASRSEGNIRIIE
jgi:hypothetical protein